MILYDFLEFVAFVLLFIGNMVFFILWRSEVGSHKIDKEYYERSLKLTNENCDDVYKKVTDYANKLAAAQHELDAMRATNTHCRQCIDDVVKAFQKHGVKL